MLSDDFMDALLGQYHMKKLSMDQKAMVLDMIEEAIRKVMEVDRYATISKLLDE